MKRHLPVIAVLLGLLAAALFAGASVPAPAAAGSAAPLTFYHRAPAGWQAKPTGALLKWQRETRLSGVLHGLSAYRVMYVSRGALNGPARGGKVFETAMVFVPKAGPVPSGGRPIVAWGHGTSGVGDSAAPSRYPWLYPEPASTPWLVYGAFVGKVGRMGYIVTCPDYEGMGTPGLPTYLNAGAEGRAMIDAVRAARHLAARLGVPASKSWAAAGHSQGGQASLAAAEMATTYGRGLSLKGVVALAPGANLQQVMEASVTLPDWYPYLGYVAWGIKADDSAGSFRFSDVLGPWIMQDVAKAPRLYFDQWWATLLLAHWDGTYPAGAPQVPQASDIVVSGWESDPAVQRFYADAAVGQRHATGSILVLQGTKDLLYKQYPTLMAQLHAVGDDVRGRVLPGQDHDMAVTYGWPWAKAFLRAHLPVH